MSTFLDRYRAGEHEQVWQELLAIGPKVRNEANYALARPVVEETMHRVRHNIETLVPRLQQIGYRFGDLADNAGYWKHVPAFTPPQGDVAKEIQEIEMKLWPLPLSLQGWAWWVGQVNLIGFHPDWPNTYDLDPLYVDSITNRQEGKPAIDYYREMHEDWRADREEFGEEEVGPFCIEIAPDDYHKADISGGTPYSIAVPCSNIDAPLLFEWHDTTFIHYPRICLRWGGFPGFERCPEHLRPVEHIKFLTEGLLPI